MHDLPEVEQVLVQDAPESPNSHVPDEASVVDVTSVVGASVVGASVVGATVVGASVVGASIVAAFVVGASLGRS